MRLLSILLLCSHCLLTAATVIDDDCNDQNVFDAVDEALRSFNNAKEDGNQFILYRITDAKIKNEDGKTHHFIEYETHESSCEVKNGKSWQECSPTYAHQLRCSVHVLFNKDLRLRSVESQNCSSLEEWPTVTAVHHPCQGCPQPIDKENKELLCFVQSAMEQVNKDANHPFYFDLESIVNATRQVVYGWNYNIRFLIRQTNCSKLNFTSKVSNDCKVDLEEEPIECTAEIFVNPAGNVYYQVFKCISKTGDCINCPVVMDPEDSEIKALLVQVMDEYNFHSNHSTLYDIVVVEKATKTGFQKHLYEITFTIGPTNCSKSDFPILGKECIPIKTPALLTCTTKINVTDKTVNVYSAPHCEMEKPNAIARISGLSPIRLSRSIYQEHNDRNDMLKLFMPVNRTERPRQSRHAHNSKGHKHGKKEKNKHKNKHQDSSEEDNNNVVAEVSKNHESFPNTEQSPLLDFPQPPTAVVPRCPGRVWQPKSISPSTPPVKTFDLDDLIFALEDLTPSSDKEIEKHEPLVPKQTSEFNDEDLLS